MNSDEAEGRGCSSGLSNDCQSFRGRIRLELFTGTSQIHDKERRLALRRKAVQLRAKRHEDEVKAEDSVHASDFGMSSLSPAALDVLDWRMGVCACQQSKTLSHCEPTYTDSITKVDSDGSTT